MAGGIASNPGPFDNPDPKDRYEIYRDYIKHEDGLINNRITWMLSIHGFLYATYGFSLQKLLETNEKISQFLISESAEKKIDCYLNSSFLGASLVQIFWFLLSLCAVGFTISGASLFSISGAFKAATAVARSFDDQHRPEPYEVNYRNGGKRFLLQYRLFGADGFRVPFLTGGGLALGEKRGFTMAVTIPIILVISWVVSACVAWVSWEKSSEIFERRTPCALLMKIPPAQISSPPRPASAGPGTRSSGAAPRR